MKHWTWKRKASFIIHTIIVLVPFSFSAVSSLLFWRGLFGSWWLSAPLVGVIDGLSLLGLILAIIGIASPFQSLRHLLPVVSVVPLGVELYGALEHNGAWVALGAAGVVTIILVLIAWQCFSTIEALFIDPVAAAKEKARAQLQQLAVAQAQLLEVQAITAQFVGEWQPAMRPAVAPQDAPHIITTAPQALTASPQSAEPVGDSLDDLKAQAAAMRAAGQSWGKIAEAVGRSVSTVRGWLVAPQDIVQEA